MTIAATGKITVLIVDDHALVRDGIRACIEGHGSIQHIYEAADGESALTTAKACHPDVVLMDISMPKVGGLVAASQIIKVMPNVKVLMLTMHCNREYVQQALKIGAAGYVLKNACSDEVIRAIEAVHRGERFLGSSVDSGSVIKGVPERSLTPRELEILAYVADGWSNKEISIQLGLSVRTVENHREHIKKKLGIDSVAALTKYAIARGIVAAT